MTPLMIAGLVAAGFGAGFINAVVGSGTLLTFPTLLFFDIPARIANVTNSVGLVPGGITSALGYREEIRATAPRLKLFVPATFVGAVAGGLLLLRLPAAAFNAIVPVLIIASLLLVVFGPAIQRWAARRRSSTSGPGAGADTDTAARGGTETPARRWLCAAGMFVSGMYGAYFGAAQGVLMIGIMNVLIDETLQHLNGIKNVLGFVNNLTAVLVFVLVAPHDIRWPVAGVLAVGGIVGAYAGARAGRRLSPSVLRAIIVVVGVVAVAKLLFFD